MKKMLLVMSMLTTFGFSGDFEDAQSAYNKKDYKKAVELYQKVINSSALIGKEKNQEALRELFINSVYTSDAQLHLGYMYETGKGVNKDLEKALELYQKSDTSEKLCSEGDRAYYKKDYEKAINFYQKGVDKNKLECIQGLAKLYADRDESKKERNTQKAKELYLLASDLGDKEALIKIGDIYKFDENWKMTYKGLNSALKYYKMSNKKYNDFRSKKEIAEAQLNLAELYLLGDGGVVKNTKKALKLYEKALYSDERIMKSNPTDTYNLARIYAELNNFKKAFPLYLNAAENGFTKAYTNIGYCYVEGKGVKRDRIKAYKAWLKIAKDGDKTAQNNLDILCKESPWACKE